MPVRGEMLWFNHEKGYGYIQTDLDERLYVAESDFLDGELPPARCKGMRVAFERHTGEGDHRAVGVHFIVDANPPRARLRHPRGGTSI